MVLWMVICDFVVCVDVWKEGGDVGILGVDVILVVGVGVLSR